MDDKETYLLLVLSDSNLPTGSFVASAGLESTATHALFHATGSAASATGTSLDITGTSTGTGTIGNTVTPTSSILAFLRNSIDTYARSALPFSRDAHRITTAYTNANGDIRQQLDLDGALEALGRIDALHDACTLNHVARRASCAQGVALLTLYARGFTCPPFLALATPQGVDDLDEQERDRECRAGALVAALKLRVRRGGESDDGALGHLPVCWGVLAGALGLSVGEQPFVSCTTQRVVNHECCAHTHSRPWSPFTPLSSRARRALRGGAHEHPRPLCRAAVASACGEAPSG